MAKMGTVDLKGLKDLQKQLNKLQDPDAFVELCAKELASVLWSALVHNTPVDNGTLRRGWIVGDIIKQGDIYKIEIINPTEYASYVEYGHRQESGRYVPAIGKTLKKGWVPGQFFMQKSIQEVENLTPKTLEDEIKKYLKDIAK